MSTAADTPEIKAIEQRYERRRTHPGASRYSPLDPYVSMVEQEKDLALVHLLNSNGMSSRVAQCSLLEIGCGGGGNLLRFLRLGFSPENLVGNDLLPDRVQAARSVLPSSIRLLSGDAASADFDDETFDLVCLFTVFSSILDDGFRKRLAAKAWSLAKPGGGVICYDFIYNNPKNPDVRAVTTRKIRELFPEASPNVQRVTLAPPIGRLVSRWSSSCYSLLNQIPMLRSHVLVWLSKDAT
jgi:SAM-dependent methyltransferase